MWYTNIEGLGDVGFGITLWYINAEGLGYATIGRNFWYINAVGSGNAVIRQKLWYIDAEGSDYAVIGKNCCVYINTNINAENRRDSYEICAVEIIYNFGTNHNDHQHKFSTILIELHAILTILCGLCCLCNYVLWAID